MEEPHSMGRACLRPIASAGATARSPWLERQRRQVRNGASLEPRVATGGNRSQIAPTGKPRNQAKTVAVRCDQLPRRAHGKEGHEEGPPAESCSARPRETKGGPFCRAGRAGQQRVAGASLGMDGEAAARTRLYGHGRARVAVSTRREAHIRWEP